MKVLISAYACEPHKGSEGGVGWNWTMQIARFADVWVITRSNNRKPVEQELQKGDLPNVHFVYTDLPGWLRFWKRGEKGLYLYYCIWQMLVFIKAITLHRKIGFHAVHHLTFGNVWLPTLLPFLPTCFIWGPIGGGERVPRAFRRGHPFSARVQESVRDVILATLKVNPLFLLACKRAEKIIVRTSDTFNIIPRRYRRKCIRMIETGVNAAGVPPRAKISTGKEIVSVGRLIYLKGFDLALKALAKASKTVDMHLVIIGDGPDRARLKRISEAEGVSARVSFKGRLSHEETVKRMSESSVFLFPSLKEGGAWVLFEAMLLGLPVVCMDIAGPGEIVDDRSGIKIKPTTPEEAVESLSTALCKLSESSYLRREMGEAGENRVQELYNWDRKGQAIRSIYESVAEAQ